MTMQQMVDEFKKRGFKADKSYIRSEKRYRFDIKKDGLGSIGYFIYPEDVDPDYKNYLQNEFINNMELTFIAELNKKKKEKKEMNMFDLMALAGNPTGTLAVGGRHFPVVISQVESTSEYPSRNETRVVCDILDPSSAVKAAINKNNQFIISFLLF